MSEGRLAGLRYFLTTLPGRAAIGLVLALLVLTAAWFGTRQAYYIGVDGDLVVIYQGVPYDLGPWSLSSPYRYSPVKVSELEPFQRDRVYAQELQSKTTPRKCWKITKLRRRCARRRQPAGPPRKNSGPRTFSQNLTLPPGGQP